MLRNCFERRQACQHKGRSRGSRGKLSKTQFPNNYRNHKNDQKFCGRALTLGEEHALFSAGMTYPYLFTHLAIIR